MGLALISTSLMGFVIPDINKKDSFYVQQYWRYVWAFQGLLALIQVILLLTVLNTDTPVELKARGDTDKLNKIMKRIYSED